MAGVAPSGQTGLLYGIIEGMIAGTDAPSKNVHDGRPSNAAKGPRYLYGSLTGICIGGAALAAAGCILGSCELVGPEVTASFLSSHLGFAIGWLLIVLFFARRMVSTGRWRVLLLGTAICWGSPALVGYMFVWGPTQKIRSSDWKPTTEAEVRSVCHRSLVWRTEPHDEVGFLSNCGDESSVPYIIWALRWMPSDEEQRDCTWGHALYALRTITNNSASATRAEWTEWYAAHKHQTHVEWWANGFTAEGYSVSATGGKESIRNLLRLLGRTPYCQPETKSWLSGNAVRMLTLMDKNDVRRLIDEVLHSGSVEERCGVARYVHKLDRADSEAILRELLRDDQRPVRLYASGMLSRLQLEWCKNPPGFIEKRLEPGVLTDDEFFSPSGSSVVTAKVGTQMDVSQWSGVRRSTIDAVPGAGLGQPDGPTCVIQIDWPTESPKSTLENLAAISIEGISPATKQTVYSRTLVATDCLNAIELRWIYDPVGDSVYVSIPNYTCKIAPKTGEVIWEMGFGTGNINYISLLKNYLIIDEQGHLVVCDAAHGGILANYDLPLHQLFDDRISLVNGQLRTKDFNGAFYMLTLPATAISDGGTSPVAQKEQ